MNLTNINLLLIFSALLPWACIVVGALITPRLTRPDLFFAVTVKPSFRVSEAARAILRQYYWIVFVAALVALLPIGLVIYLPSLLLMGLLGPIVIEIAGFFTAFLVARSRTLPYHTQPTLQREAELAPRRAKLPGGWLAQAGPYLILAGIAVYLALNWQQIPERFPIHWGIDGRPNGWGSRNVASVFSTVFIGGMICLLLGAIQYAITHAVRRINSSGNAAARETRFVRAISMFLLGMEYWLALLMGMIGLSPLRAHGQAPFPSIWLVLIGQTVVIGTIFVIAYRMGQGGSRLQTSGQTEKSDADAPPVGDRTPDECWKLGVFYYNPNDPALLVEKRFGVGWTFNFANRGAWWALGAILLFAVASIVIAVVASHQKPH